MSFNWPTPRVLWEYMGAKHGGLLAIDVLLEKGQERVKISCKSPDTAFVSNSPRKHRQGLGNETVPWNVACIQISSLSLSRLLPPSHALESSSSKVICAGPGWHISARRAVKFFHQDFPSVVQTPIKYESFFPEITPLFNGDIPPYTVYPYLTLVSPSHWQITIPFVLRSTWSQIWLRDQHLFKHLHIRDWVRIHLSAAHLLYLKLLVRWISRLFLRGVGKWSLCLSMSQWIGM